MRDARARVLVTEIARRGTLDRAASVRYATGMARTTAREAQRFERAARPMNEVAVSGLTRHPSSLRLDKLSKERDRLVAKVAGLKREQASLVERARQAASDVQATILPLIEKHQAIALEIRRLFDELLAEGRLSPSARKKVRAVSRIVADACDLGDLGDVAAGGFHGAPSDVAGEEVASAQARGGQRGQDSLRGLFKRLALALHPDRASDDEERDRRTEVMKEVTRAYDEGDLARLVDLEIRWSARAPAASNDEHETRCVELAAVNRALRAQISMLERELRALRREVRGPVGVPMSAAAAAAEQDLARLAEARDFVRAFRDGRISLREFLAGPPPPEGEEDFPAEMIDELAALFGELDVQSRPPKRRSRRRR